MTEDLNCPVCGKDVKVSWPEGDDDESLHCLSCKAPLEIETEWGEGVLYPAGWWLVKKRE